jgi:membrane protein
MPARELVRRLLRELGADAVLDTSAQLGYYLLFAIFPFLFFLTALAAYLPLESSIETVMVRARDLLPPEAYRLVEQHMRALLANERPEIISFSIVASLWSASRGVDAVRRALNLAYDVTESRPWWRTQLVSIGMTVLGALLVFVGIALLVAGGAVGRWVAERVGIGSSFVLMLGWLRWPATAMLVMLVTALAYFLLPDVKQEFKYITPGSVLGTIVWLAGTWAFGQYVSRFGSYNVTYGSIGGVIVLLAWLYLSSLIFIMGGELNAILEHASASGKEAGARAEGERPPPPSRRPSASPPGAVKTAAHAAREGTGGS